ncbi:putative mediator of RNA polymerase II transcription subunit 26 [Rhagoletis pomonella]|uniref:putative mediator of RNA polymerase II transcription subunit 26 n=1 Tax=Rhagoletis pomonella TaxID=28610 RepID=UPI00177F0E0D|nr:putative mediator of RNA polymerase II transcription subunit 26 [Rhagoletis pomonella]XP_036325638.1 putative mediator of RNA polymerase II transcription subunit 26 [Rhagoletis pomonella]
MAFSRHNIEKRRLIELVRLNSILWDCRLPHYKRSDKKKALKWNELGRVFGVSGERVQRTFTSLREIFRRELNHEKMLGVRFKSKWEYYDAMAFLKEVIRERKSRERNKTSADANLPQQQQQHSNNNSSAIDEYQYFAPNDPNNPNNQPQIQISEQQQVQPAYPPLQQQQQQQQVGTLPLPSQQHLPQLPPSNVPQPTHAQQNSTATGPLDTQQQQHLPQSMLSMQPDVVLGLNGNATATLHNLGNGNGTLAGNSRPPSQQQQQQLPPQQPQRHQFPPPGNQALVAISSSRSSSSSPSIYIKEEPDSPDTLSLTTITINEHDSSYLARHAETKNKNAQSVNSHVKGSMPIGNSKNNGAIRKSKSHIDPSSASLIIDEDFAGHDADLDDLDDPDVDMLDDGRLSPASTYTLGMASKPNRLTAREILYTKFGDFLAARLNTLNETVANDLMNRILLLIAEK